MSRKLSPITAAREKQALDRRIAGQSYTDIASSMGMANRSAAWKIVQRALDRSVSESADDLRVLEVQRLDILLGGIWDRAKSGNLSAIDRALLIMRRRAEMLGLDAPKKIAPTNPEGTQEYAGLSDNDIARELAAMAELVRTRALSQTGGERALPVGQSSASESDATD